MLKRIGIVAWWVGLFILLPTALLTAYLLVNAEVRLARCPGILAEDAAWQRLYEQEEEKFSQSHKTATHNPPGSGMGMLPDVNPDDFDALLSRGHSEKMRPRRSGLDEDVKECESLKGNRGKPLLGLGLGLLLGIPFLSLAYILGGSFWRPPRVTGKP